MRGLIPPRAVPAGIGLNSWKWNEISVKLVGHQMWMLFYTKLFHISLQSLEIGRAAGAFPL
jgi:hypothetical protein